MVEPEILLLDEPLSNLDAKLREQMRVELKRLQRRTGITFVYVTHDQAEALALSDQIAVIHGGRLQQYGTPQEVYARPANRVVADFMGLVNLVPAKVRRDRRRRHDRGGRRAQARGPLPDGIKAGDSVEVAIRPENIRLQAPAGNGGARAKISERTFLGNISEYYASLDSGPDASGTDPSGQVFAVGDKVAVEIDATQCSVFRSSTSQHP